LNEPVSCSFSHLNNTGTPVCTLNVGAGITRVRRTTPSRAFAAAATSGRPAAQPPDPNPAESESPVDPCPSAQPSLVVPVIIVSW
jgi:hypothetical protein